MRIATLILISLLVVILAIGVLMFTSTPRLTDFVLIERPGVVKKIDLPYSMREYPVGSVSFKGIVNYSFYTQGLLRIIPDDIVEYIKINGKNVPLDEVDPSNLGNYDNGFFYNLSPFLNQGRNFIEIGIYNRGGPFGLAIYSELNKYLLEFTVSMFIIILLFIFLRNDISTGRETWHISFFMMMATIAALLLRFLLFKHISADYSSFFSPWFDFMKNHGFWDSLKERFSDYTPPYLYLLGIGTFLPVEKVVSIKIMTSLFFDFLAGVYVFKIVKVTHGRNILIPALAYGLFLFAPTVVLNGSFWGQSDIIFTTFCLMSIYYLMTKKLFFSMVLYGIALSVKLQAIFLAPFFLFFILTREMPVHYIMILPIVFIISLIPTILAGRPILDALSIYVSQSQSYKSLTLNAPTLYQWLPNSLFETLSVPSVIYAACLTSILLFWLLHIMKSVSLAADDVVLLALLFAVFVPFFLPKMHERYFFLADVIALVHAFYFPKRFFIAPTIWLASFFSYGPFLFGVEIIPIKYFSLGMLTIICYLLYSISANGSLIQKERLAKADA